MKKLSVIIPVLNEARTIAEIVRRVDAEKIAGWEKEIIIVDGDSSDGSKEILLKLRESINFLLIIQSGQKGKGAAIKLGLQRSTGDAVLIQDADLEYDPGDYSLLLSAYSRGNDVVYGSRNLLRQARGYLRAYLGGRLITSVMNTLFGSKLTDVNTCYKLFDVKILRGLEFESDGFAFCEEVTAKVLKSGKSIVEVPIKYAPRTYKEGKKIKLRDGMIAIWTILRCRFLG